jgi:hypothetical protein
VLVRSGQNCIDGLLRREMSAEQEGDHAGYVRRGHRRTFEQRVLVVIAGVGLGS